MADSARNTGPPSIQPIKEKQWQFQKRLEEHYLKRGSRYFPFSIEPMQHVRDRLHKPMTAEERALRKQWVQDQILSPNEPRNVPEATPKNIIRRIYRYPWDKIYAGLKPLIVSSWLLIGILPHKCGRGMVFVSLEVVNSRVLYICEYY